MRVIFRVFFISWILVSCATNHNNKDMDHNNDPKYTNDLIHESSPYLLQHAHNPVDWVPWGDEAFEKAKEENKLVLISIGYSSCHWCHVMAHESFEDEKVAEIMNENFVCIKVDREERPDVDQVYMTAVQLMTGSGGWPLNCFALPDGRPIHGGTYFPRIQWMELLVSLSKSYQNNPDEFIAFAEKLSQGINDSELVTLNSEEVRFSSERLDEMVVNWKRGFDNSLGGPNRAPKFPMPNNYDFLMQYAYHNLDTSVMDYVDLTLQKMAFGGIYDQIGGGFSRYSTDINWKVPHFEKMLYDNAQLVSLYSHAYQRTKSPLFKHIVYQTLQWVEREMTTKEGSFYSALDADSEGEEGKFYVWSKEELKSVLEDDYDFVSDYYNLNWKGQWEGNFILLREESNEEIAEKEGISVEEVELKFNQINEQLLIEREKRIRPGLDDKSLTSWNALMLIGYLDAYQAFGDEAFLNSALENANWLKKNQLQKEGKLYHTYKNGKSTIDGFLEDYCFTIEAFIKLYECTFDETWLVSADLLMDYTNKHFYDETSGMFFFTSDEGSQLISRKMEVNDNVIPASNSSMAKAMWKLGTLTGNTEYVIQAEQMLFNVFEKMHTYGPSYSNWALLTMNIVHSYYEVAITGPNWQDKTEELNSHYLPNKILMGGEKGELPLLKGKFGDETTIFVCVNKSCQLPVKEVSKAVQQIRP